MMKKAIMIQFVKKEALVIAISQFNTMTSPAVMILAWKQLDTKQRATLTGKLNVRKYSSDVMTNVNLGRPLSSTFARSSGIRLW